MRQIALLLGLATMVFAVPTLSEPRKISGINARTIVSDGQYAYVDNGATIYRLQRTDEGVKKKLAEQIHARAFEVGTHAPLGEFFQPMAARKNISGFFVTNGNIYWNLKKN